MMVALVFAGIVSFVGIGCFALGHYVTMRAISHLQPPAREMMSTGHVANNVDPLEDSEEAFRLYDETSAKDSKQSPNSADVSEDFFNFLRGNTSSMKPAGVHIHQPDIVSAGTSNAPSEDSE